MTLAVLTAGPTKEQSNASGIAAQERSAPVYAHSLDGFREQYGQVLQSFKSGDAGKAKELARAYRLPDAKSWVSRNFEAEKVPELLQRYEEAIANFESTFLQRLEEGAQVKHFELKIEAKSRQTISTAEMIAPMQEIPLEGFSYTVQGDGLVSISWGDTFVHYDGAFRFVGAGASPFWARKKQPGPMGGLPRQARLVYSVPPVYPLSAKAKGIEGVVRLKALIAKDGTVQDLQVLAGHPELTGAALEAVRQWRYEPVKLNGKPMEVPTTIDVVFQLGRR